jgi:hypothetical protein
MYRLHPSAWQPVEGERDAWTHTSQGLRLETRGFAGHSPSRYVSHEFHLTNLRGEPVIIERAELVTSRRTYVDYYSEKSDRSARTVLPGERRLLVPGWDLEGQAGNELPPVSKILLILQVEGKSLTLTVRFEAE